MPRECSQSVLTGQDGSVYFTPAGTSHCLLDLTDFPAGATINLPITHDFRPGDPVVFRPNGGRLTTGLTAGTTYWIGLVQPTAAQLLVSRGGTPVNMTGNGGIPAGSSNSGTVNTLGTFVAGAGYVPGTYPGTRTSGGSGTNAQLDITVGAGGSVSAVTVNASNRGDDYVVGDVLTLPIGSLGGTGSGFQVTVATITATAKDTPGADIRITYAEYAAVCQVANFTLNLTREQLETTSIPCGIGVSQTKYAPFRTRQPGYADGTGSMTVRFSRDQSSLASRLLSNSMLRSQDGARAKFYIDAVSDGNASNPKPDDLKSLFIEAPISIDGFSATVSPDTPTEASLDFSFSGQPTRIGSVDLV